MKVPAGTNFLKNNYYYIELSLATVIAFFAILVRCRLGIDLTDEAWYVADPYWVAKGSTPYVNNWTQASGFTLPLFIPHYLYLKLVGSNEGIVLFSRILYCVWKTVVSVASVLLLKKARIQLPAVLIIPMIVFVPHELFDINYNTIGLAYVLLAYSITALSLNNNNEYSDKDEALIGLAAGIVIGRCVIGTPATVIAVVWIILILTAYKKFSTLKGFILGGTADAVAVVGFCCLRGGINGFIVGIQYFFRDNGYYETLEARGQPLTDIASEMMTFLYPAIIALALASIIALVLKKKRIIRNCIILLICIGFLAAAINELSFYSGKAIKISDAMQYTWCIPLLCIFVWCSHETKRKIVIVSLFNLIMMSIDIFQGFTTISGIADRSYWNVYSILFGIYCILICIEEMLSEKKYMQYAFRLSAAAAGVLCAVFLIRGAYMYVFRDMPVENLTTRIEQGVWKGCYTTANRSGTIEKIEKELNERTDERDRFLCYGKWACFMNLLCNGKLCSSSALGAGTKTGFDYWHMYQTVPDKVFVNIDEDDRSGLMTDDRPVWVFISTYYKKTGEIQYTSYLDEGKPIEFRIIEYEITDREKALQYADRMATKVLSF